ncbi:MAG: hypothetical protein WCA46_08775 [Actinocatenispora sp.]
MATEEESAEKEPRKPGPGATGHGEPADAEKKEKPTDGDESSDGAEPDGTSWPPIS